MTWLGCDTRRDCDVCRQSVRFRARKVAAGFTPASCPEGFLIGQPPPPFALRHAVIAVDQQTGASHAGCGNCGKKAESVQSSVAESFLIEDHPAPVLPDTGWDNPSLATLRSLQEMSLGAPFLVHPPDSAFGIQPSALPCYFSLWTTPLHTNKARHWAKEQWLWTTLALAAHRARQYFRDVILFTDFYGAGMARKIGLPFTEIQDGLSQFTDSTRTVWVRGKFACYAAQTKPFVHLDCDVFLWRQPRADWLAAPLGVQLIETFPTCKWLYPLARFKAQGDYVPDWWDTGPQHAVNSGVLVFNDLALTDEYVATALEVHDRNQAKLGSEYPQIKLNCIIEQYILAGVAQKRGVKPACYIEGYEDFMSHWQAGLTHLGGGGGRRAKVDDRMNDLVAWRLKQDDPDLADRLARFPWGKPSAAQVGAASQPRPAIERLIFVHIPKTAGLALHRQLETHFHECRRFGTLAEVQAFQQFQINGEQYLSGHVPLPAFQARGLDWPAVAIVREPVERLLSLYRFLRRAEYPEHEPWRDMGFDDFLAGLPDNPHYQSACTYLAGVDDFSAARAMIEVYRVLVAPLDRYGELLETLGERLSDRFLDKKVNVTPSGEPVELTEARLDVIEPIIRQDRLLWQHVNANWPVIRDRFQTELSGNREPRPAYEERMTARRLNTPSAITVATMPMATSI